MNMRKLGTSDLQVSPIIMGTWAIGGWLWGGTKQNHPEEAITVSLDTGVNAVDTAPAYGFGLSEELVGQAIRKRRNDLLVATKCGLIWDDRPGSTPFFETSDASGRRFMVSTCLRKASILRECDESLQRLQVDTIDLYQCHWPDPGTPIEETMDALLTLKEQGKIRAFGVSNYTAEQLGETITIAKPVSNQVKYSLLSREIEKEDLPFCRDQSIGVLAYSPMEMGLLTGKVTMDTDFPETDTRRTRPWFQPDKRKQVLEALETIRPLARELGCTLAQLSVAWICTQPGVSAAIVGARNGDQARQNAEAARLKLAPEQESRIRNVFTPLGLDTPYDPSKAKR